MYRTSLPTAVVLALLSAACGKTNEPVRPPSPPKETVFDDMIANKERAKQTTDRAMEQDRAKHEAALKESGADAAP